MSRSTRVPTAASVAVVNGRFSAEWSAFMRDIANWSGLRGAGFSIWERVGAGLGGWHAVTASVGVVSGALYGYQFASGASNAIACSMPVPAAVLPSTAITPVVLWVPSDGGSGDVRWQYELSSARGGAVLPVSETKLVTSAASGQQCALAVFGATDLTVREDDSVLQSLTRLGADAADTYSSNAFVLWAGFLYRSGGLGSATSLKG